jgi:glycosyltransferase involved in cell wall biosynthesis
MNEPQKLAIISDQLAGGIGGAEFVAFTLMDLYPHSDIYTTVYNKHIIPAPYNQRNVYTTYIQNLPWANKFYKAYFPLMPFAVEFLNMQEYDVILSLNHSVAKGIIPRPDAHHICYCYSPARYIWDMFWVYSDLNRFNIVQKIFISAVSNYIRTWDAVSSNRVDTFVAISRFVARRIKKYYNRDSLIIYPPVNTNNFHFEENQDYYLMAGRLVAYKGFELAVEAFNQNGKRLIIVGDGAEYKKLKAMAGKNIEMPGRVSQTDLIKYFSRCKGFLFPGKEDFGIVMAEAQAAGKPVIAFDGGGAKDIIIDKETGILFKHQTTTDLNAAIELSEKTKWDHEYINTHATKFDISMFKAKMTELIDSASMDACSY